jgi:hypothetical protein
MSIRGNVGGALFAGALFGVLIGGCGGKGDEASSEPMPSTGSAGMAGSAAGSGGAAEDGNAGAAGSGFGGISGKPTSTPDGNTPDDITPDDITPPPPDVLEMLDPSVDWEGFTIIFPTMYSAHDGVHTFQVPAHIEGATVELSDWQAIPSDAVTFDPDPEVEGGVLITVERAVEQITIAASAGAIGGTAALFVTSGTPEQWATGEARYNNGVDFELPGFEDIDFSMLLDPNWMPPSPPDDLACNNCHTTGAKYFEFQHTPTQAARFSDEDLRIILTMGMKPEGVGFRILPEMLGSQTAAEVYADYHTWTATEEEVEGLIIYLRSLTPTGQGDIRLPDGTYVAPGERPSNWPPMP